MAGLPARSVLIAAVLGAGGLAISAEPGTPTSSSRHVETFEAAQTALAAKDYAVVTARAREVLASSRKSPDDIYIAYNFLTQAARDPDAQIAGIEGMLESGFQLGAQTQSELHKVLVTAYFDQKNYPQALKYGTALIGSGAADEEVYSVVGQSYFHSSNYSESVKIFERLVSSDEDGGRRPDRLELVMLLSSHDKAGNREPAQATIEKLVRHYPEANAWLLLLQEVKSERLDARQKIHFFRLMESTGNLKHGRDFMTYSDAATSLGLPGESRRVLETAMTAKVFEQESDRSRADQHLAAARERAEAHRAELLELESEATAAATGNEFVALGMAHYSFGQYPNAIEALQAGIAKGGLKNAADAQLTLGAAQLKSGQKAEAAQTLKAINAGDEVTQRIVRLWALHAS